MKKSGIILWICIGLAMAAIAAALIHSHTPAKTVKKDAPVFLFKDISGPQERTVVPEAKPARWQDHEHGGAGRLAILLTDPDSSWLGLVHGLRSIGVPFLITRDYRKALRHRVALVYPTISGRVLSAEALQALVKFPAEGGTLIGVNVEGGGLNEVFGFSEAQPAKTRCKITFDSKQTLAAPFGDLRENIIPFSSPRAGANGMGSFCYTGAVAPLAHFDDGTAAITARRVGNGHAYAFGVDLGFFLLKGYNNREENVARSYVNQYEPALDVLLRLLRDIYREGEPSAVTLGTVPEGKSLSVLLTHDIDYGSSLANAVQYAEYEASAGLRATYFVQTKYVRDWSDDAFFNDEALVPLRRLRELDMEIASHSVAHSDVFNRMPLGDGEERYPQYRPFARDKTHTENGTILGELRVSRFLLEHFLPGYRITTFRPGHLKNPYALPQALEATGYLYSSSVTANNSLTHLPFRLNYGRETAAESRIYEFPVTIEDEEEPRLGDRLQPALDLTDRLAGYGGLCVVLIHPNITGHKLKFEQQFVEALRPRAWFGTMRDFGAFWTARDNVAVDIERQGTKIRVSLTSPGHITGLTLQLPAGYRVTSAEPKELVFTQKGDQAVLGDWTGNAALTLELSPG